MSLTALAHAATPAPPPFNADFYLAAATILPVLFNAINVQPAYQAIAQKTSALTTGMSAQPAAIIFLAAYYYILQALAVIAEFSALLALDHRSAPPYLHTLVFTALAIQTIAAGLGPVIPLINLPETKPG